MLSTRSAAGNGLPAFSRRRFATALSAAAPMVMAASLPALAIPDGDAHLFDLGRQWERLTALAAEADRQLAAVSAIYDRACPDVEPDALFVRPDDDLALRTWPEKRKGTPTGRHVYGPTDIETAEAALSALSDEELPGGNDPQVKAKLARLREIVASYRSDRETRRAAWHAAGVKEAELAYEAAHDRCRDARSQIIQCPATTIAGVMLKARIVAECFGDTIDEVESVLDELIGNDAGGESVAFSIARDLIRIAGRTNTGGLDA